MQTALAQRSSTGWGNGLLGVIIFSGSLPATRAAVSGFDPFFLTSIRATIAALLGLAFLGLLRQPLPKPQDIVSLVIVAVGVVIGFPLLSALALQQMTAAQSLVLMGALPVSTAIFAVIRGGERPKPLFWVFSGVGCLVVAAFALSQNAEARSWALFICSQPLLFAVLDMPKAQRFPEGLADGRSFRGPLFWLCRSWRSQL